MHIRKVRGPRTVQLPDGGFLSRGDLPPPTTNAGSPRARRLL